MGYLVIIQAALLTFQVYLAITSGRTVAAVGVVWVACMFAVTLIAYATSR